MSLPENCLTKIEVGQSMASPQTLCRPVYSPALPLFRSAFQGETTRHGVQLLLLLRIKHMFLDIA
jgi:hypothetical protein